MDERSPHYHKEKSSQREAFSRSLDDSGLAATPRCPPIRAQHSDDVTRRHDNSSPSSASTSSHESGIKSTTDTNSSPEHHVNYYCNYRFPEHLKQETALGVQDDSPLDLSVTSLLPRQRTDSEKAVNVRPPAVASIRPDNDTCLPTLTGNILTSDVSRCRDNRGRSAIHQSLLSNAHCHGNGNQLPAPPPFVHEKSTSLLSNTQRNFTDYHCNRNQLPVSPLLGNAHLQLQPRPVYAQSPQYRALDDYSPLTASQDVATDASSRMPEPAKLLLTSWYETHFRHPYPQPHELSQLVMATGQSRRKILKWLANRRARTGNTLPHNGSVHPRKIVKIRQLRQIADTEEPHQRIGPRRGQRSARFLPDSVVDGLQRWYSDHLGYPYPTETEKRRLADQLGTTVVKVTNWFANKRNRSGHGARGVGVPRLSSGSFGGQPQPEQLAWGCAGVTPGFSFPQKSYYGGHPL